MIKVCLRNEHSIIYIVALLKTVSLIHSFHRYNKHFESAIINDVPVPSLSSNRGFTKDGLTTSNHQNSSAMNTR